MRVFNRQDNNNHPQAILGESWFGVIAAPTRVGKASAHLSQLGALHRPSYNGFRPVARAVMEALGSEMNGDPGR